MRRRPSERAAAKILYIAIFGVALVATVLSATGRYVADFRFELVWSPGHLLTRMARLWDSTGGLGRPGGAEGSLLPTVFLAVVRGLGLPPWLAQRFWHTFLLGVAGSGVVGVMRWFRPRLDVGHVLAAAWYMFNPISLSLLLPSGIYVDYAIAPWLLLALLRGGSGEQRWRWAGVFTLAVIAAAPSDLPGVIFALAPLLLAGGYLVLVARTATVRSLFSWVWRTAVLLIPASSFVVLRTLAGNEALSARLLQTESPAAVAVASSWSESLRGLGNWLTYFRLGEQAGRPQHAAYLTSPFVIAATFAVPIVAIGGGAFVRWRGRLLFLLVLPITQMVMVGAFGFTDLSPWGQLMTDAYTQFPALGAFRNTTKIGGWLALAVGALFGVAVVEALRRLPPARRAARVVLATVAFVVVALAALPALTGSLYPPDNQLAAVPAYWHSALGWLNDHDTDRVLVLPGTSSTRYRWGSPGDDIFNALLSVPALKSEPFARSTPPSADLVDAIDTRVADGMISPGDLAPVLRRIGVRYVLVRNDLDWETLDRPRPDSVQRIRDDPGLVEVASFGDPGQNTVSPIDQSAAASRERRLPPVQVFQVAGFEAPVRVGPSNPGLLLEGDAAGWFALASHGLLSTGGPITYVGTSGPDTWKSDLAQGASAVITDTNVRRITVLTGSNTLRSSAIGLLEYPTRASSTFAGAANQTTAWYPDATAISASSLSPAMPWNRPSAAFDDDPTTAWIASNGLTRPESQWLRVDLRHRNVIQRISMLAANTGATRVEGHVSFDGGRSVPFKLESQTVTLNFSPVATSAITFTIDRVVGPPLATAGIAEIKIPGLDFQEYRKLPDALAAAAQQNPALRAQLGVAPLLIDAEREQRPDGIDVEAQLRRLLRVPVDRVFSLGARIDVLPDSDTAHDLLAHPPGECFDGLIAVDDQPVAVQVNAQGVVEGRIRVEIASCDGVFLSSGWHRVQGTSIPLDRLWLSAGSATAASSLPTEPRTVSQRPGEIHAIVDVPAGGEVLYSGQSFHHGWRAFSNGQALGAPQLLDGQSAWVLPSGHQDITLRFEPERLYGVALAVSLIAVGSSGWLALRRPKRQP